MYTSIYEYRPARITVQGLLKRRTGESERAGSVVGREWIRAALVGGLRVKGLEGIVVDGVDGVDGVDEMDGV